MINRLKENKSFYWQAILVFTLTYIVISLGFTMRIYQILLRFPIRLSWNQLLANLVQSSLYPYILILTIIFLIIFLFIRNIYTKIGVAIITAIIMAMILISRIPGSAGLGAVGIVIYLIINLLLLIIVFISISTIENHKENSTKRLFRINLVLGIIAVILIVMNLFSVISYGMEESILAQLDSGEYTDLASGLAACNKIASTGAPIDKRHECIKSLAIKEGNITICSLGSEFVRGDSCIAAVAKKVQDIQICNQMEKPKAEGHLTDSQLFNIEATWANQRRDCAMNAIGSQTDIGICENLEDDLIKSSCLYAIALNDPKIETCLMIEPYMWRGEKSYNRKDSCLEEIIKKVGTKQDCNLISNDGYWEKKRCNDYFDSLSK